MCASGISTCKFLLDPDLTILSASDGYYRSIGFTGDEYAGLFPTLRDYYKNHTDEFNKLKDSANTAMSAGECSFTTDCRMPVKDGLYIHVRITGSLTNEMAGNRPVCLAVFTDITDLIRVRDEKAEAFLWLMDEYTGNVYISDMDTYELLYLNKESCKTLQGPPSEFVGRKCYEVIQGRTSPCPFCTNSKLTRDKFYEWEFFNPILDRTFLIKNRMIDWNGHRSRIELSHDMFSVEYKLAKKDREREALLRTIPGGFARIDARDFSTVLWYGANFLATIGYTKEQFEQELHSKCTYFHPDDWERTLSVMEDIRSTRQSAVLETRIITYGGKTKILTLTLCYVSGEESWDGIPSFYSVDIDVTDERQEQERQRKALEEAYQTARVANSAKTNFLSSMSHDIRTPMNAIMGMAAIARANLSAPEKVSDCLSKINVSSRHLLNLINEVLDMSKIESGKIDLTPEEVNLPELIQNVTDMCRPLVTEKKQELQIHVGQVLHERFVADGDRLQQVFMNLLSNSIKYTPEGGTICVMISERYALHSKKSQYEFIFTDNGIGMSPEFIPHLFEPFSRAEDSRTSKTQGTGLGMAITENIIRMMNGSIEVESQIGVGSRFTVTVQFDILDDEECCDKELVGLPVLVVDDDQIVCENAAALLNELGMRGFWVLSGAEAIVSAENAHSAGDDFFAVILDWVMPEMDGLETLKALRQRLGENVPIIIISAYDYSNIEDEFVRAGADAFITKPLFKSKMLHVLQLFCNMDRNDSDAVLSEKELSPLAGRRVLLAEDNELNREIATELLVMEGIKVDTALNGQQACERFMSSVPGYYSAILMDIQMPIMNGYEATANIRQMDRSDARKIPVIALTANAFTADVAKSHSVGMNDHVAKPIDIERLMETLQRWIV